MDTSKSGKKRGRGGEPNKLIEILGEIEDFPVKKAVEINMKKKNEKKFSRNKLVFVNDLIEYRRKQEEGKKKLCGFTTSVLVQANLPYKSPGKDADLWVRKNGDFSLTVQPFVTMDKEGKKINYGIPYGIYPRLAMIYFCGYAIKTGSQKILLGQTMREFMARIGVNAQPSAGNRGTLTRLKKQIYSLITCNIHFGREGKLSNNKFLLDKPVSLSKESMLWWSPKNPEQEELFESYITLTDEFFKEITSSKVPIDLEAVKMLKHRPIALDFYCWLTYRVSYLKAPVRILYKDLMEQLGVSYDNTKNFKKHAIKPALTMIQELWPYLNIEEITGGILLKPSKTHISKKKIIEDKE